MQSPYYISPVLFAIAEALEFFSDKFPADESALLKGTAAFLRVVTVYLIAKGYILAAKFRK